MKIFGYNITKSKKKVLPLKGKTSSAKKEPSIKSVVAPAGRVSVPTNSESGNNVLTTLKSDLRLVKHSSYIQAIPIIRKLYKVNEDIGSVLYDAIQLTNTGHTVYFDPSVSQKDQEKMKLHLDKVSKKWGYGTAGINGLVNKWIAQIYVSGALSIEWVPDMDLMGVENCAIINPETIVFGMDKRSRYIPYQKNTLMYGLREEYIKLNPHTYKYIGLFGDEDVPYGIPPFLTALSSIKTQKDMKANINHILNQLGLLGYLEVKVDKPTQEGGESITKYKERLDALLTQSKTNILQGFKEGVVVGFMEDHDFEFHATTKNLSGVSDLFNMNENQIANGLKTSAAFLGVKNPGSESFGSIVFTKMLSQLKNVQEMLIQGLVMGYRMELELAGFDFKEVYVEFKASTITDDLKIQQAVEIKQRNMRNMWLDGIISQDTYASEMDYDKAHVKRDPVKLHGPNAEKPKDALEKKEREDDKDKSDRTGRDKKNPQPKRRDQETKPR